MSLPAGFLDEIRSRVSLAQVVGRKLAWDPRKSNPGRGDWWAPCPFHQEKTASFHVDEAKGYYYCFGCQAKGDAVTFLRETENLGFMDAVERLAAEAGLTLPDQDPTAAVRAEANRGLVEAMEAAVRFYRAQLTGARAAHARAYLDRRGLGAAARERFEVGFAPDSRTALLEHLTGKGFARDRLAEAGLIAVRDGSAYDRFRGRVVFPIRDARGRAIAFGARAISPGQEPKYLNSPDTPLFDKGRTLYNVGPAQAAARKAGTVIVAEGYLDVIALAQAGLEHAVAPLGTAITEAQLGALWKLAPEPVVALDGDPAGLAAAHRLIDLALPLLGPGRSLRFALMPPGQDPDDVVRAGGAAAIAPLLAGSRPIVDLLWSRETEGAVLDSPERRAALDARLRAHLARIADPSLRGHWEREIRARRAALFAPPPRPPQGRAPGRPRPAAPRAAVPLAASPPVRSSVLARVDGSEARIRESAILYGCLNHPAEALRLEGRLERQAFRCRDLAEIRDALLSALAEPLDDAVRVAAAVAARLGRDPLAELAAPGQVRANPHLGPKATPEMAARALDEALERYAALTGRADEVRDALAELADEADETITERVRVAAETEQAADHRPLQDDRAGEESERLEFATVVQPPVRRPRRS
jgi:DNA primase